MNKKIKSTVLIGLLSIASISAYTYSQNGLDSNLHINLDTRLERISSEESLFSMTAETIASFVIKQKEARRKMRDAFYGLSRTFTRDSVLNEYKRVLKDIPNNGNYATRDVHRKTHGCFKANFLVDQNLRENINNEIDKSIIERHADSTENRNPLPERIEQGSDLGVFQPGKQYKALVRLSNGNPRNRHDKFPDARGFAVKLLPENIDLENGNALDLNKNTVLDILSINFPTFFVNSAIKYKTINKLFLNSALDNRGVLSSMALEGASVFLPRWLRGAGMTKLEQTLALKVNGSIIQNPLFENYFSMVPSRLGIKKSARAVKYTWEPIACDGSKLSQSELQRGKPEWSNNHNYAYPVQGPFLRAKVPASKYENPYYLREKAKSTLVAGKFCYQLYFQMYRDQKSTNIEDSKDIWISSEEERKDWLKNVASEVGDSNYTNSIKNKKLAPRIKAAILTLDQVESDHETANSKFCEDLSFNPWHGNTQLHKPLGQISRMKQKVYNLVRRTRHQLNGIDSKSLENQRTSY
ncbi:hypothetical protein A9Q84_15345 [Halobacteriovorax marinus]|uniref:Uncharacterized protein n=1 Tax=Halobacteriovorax marinus TaxID=97084 RepID=A0A1Y5F5D5_9BACT|nr:hypothetical protein A9Q84_15345 [Halobacteriovorax marinus]